MIALTAANHSPDPIGSWAISQGMDDILQTSCQLMAARGFHGTSMRDLAQATGRSLSGLYHHFRSKEDLLFLINLHGFTTLTGSWSKLDGTFDKPREKLYAFIFFHTSYFVEHMDEMRVMTWGTQVLNLEKARMIQKLKDGYTRSAQRVVRAVCEAANSGDIDDRRLERETFLLFGMMNWIFTWYAPTRHGMPVNLIDDIYRTFVSGIADGVGNDDDLGAMAAAVGRSFRANKASSMWATGESEADHD